MAEIKIGVNEAIEQLNKLLAKLNEFKAIGTSIGEPSGKSLKKLATDLKEVTAAESELIIKTKALSDAVKEQAAADQLLIDKNNKMVAAFDSVVVANNAVAKSEKKKLTASKQVVAQGNKEYSLQQQKIKANEASVASINKTIKARKDNIKATLKEADAIYSNKQAIDRQRQSALKAIETSKKGQAQAKNLKSSFSAVRTQVMSLISAFGVVSGVQIFANLIKNAFQLTKQFDSLEFSMKKTVGTAGEIGNAWSFLTRLAKDYGAELLTLTNRYVKFFVAAKQSGVTLKDTQKIFETFTKVAGVMGLQTHELEGVFLALEQMLSKGKVTTEELRRQLGERLPGALGIMATAVRGANGEIGVTIEKLDEMLKKGEVLSAEVLPRFAEAVEVAYGIEAVNKVETLVSSQNRLTTAWQLFVKTVTGDESKVSSVLSNIFEFFEKGIEGLRYRFASEMGKVNILATDFAEDINKEFREAAFKDLGKAFEDEFTGLRGKIKLLTDELDVLNQANIGGQNDELIKTKEQQIADYASRLIEMNGKISESDIKYAKTHESTILQNFAYDKAAFEAGEARIKQLQALQDAGSLENNQTSELIAKKEAQEGLNTAYAASTAELLKIKTILDKPSKPVISDGGEGVKDPTDRNLAGDAFRIRLENAIKINEDIIDANILGFDRQNELAETNATHQKAIATTLANELAQKERDRLKKEIESKKWSKEQIEKLELDSAEKINKIYAKKNSSITKSEQKLSDQNIKIIENRKEKEKEALDRELAAESLTFAVKESAENKRFLALSKEQQNELSEIDKHNKIKIQLAIDLAQAELDILFASGQLTTEEYARRTSAIDELKISLNKIAKGDGDAFSTWIESNIQLLDALIDTVNNLADLANAFSEQKLQALEKEQEALDKAHEKDMERLDESTERSIDAVSQTNLSAEEKAERAEGIRLSAENAEKLAAEQKLLRDEAIAKKEVEVKRKQAKIDKAAAIATIAMDTLIGVSKLQIQAAVLSSNPLTLALASVPLSLIPTTIANGAIATATVLATPLPAFAEGGTMDKNGDMLINDHISGRQEYINRGGKILTTDKKNAVVKGQKGDKIYKDSNEMFGDLGYNMMLGSVKQTMKTSSNLFMPMKLQAQDFSGIESSISKGIKKGFRGVSNTNNINVNLGHENYLKSKQQ